MPELTPEAVARLRQVCEERLRAPWNNPPPSPSKVIAALDALATVTKERDVAILALDLEQQTDLEHQRAEEYKRLLEAEKEARQELEDLFDLRHRADARAITRWREAHPEQPHISPDQADLCVWLMDQLAAWQSVAAALGVTTAEEALAAVQGIPDGLRTVLQDHWLVDIICDHEAKTDQAVCNCAVEALPVCPSVGLAVAAWIEHVLTKAAPWLPREEPTHD